MPKYVQLTPGDPAPTFAQKSPANPRYVFDTAAGRILVLCFFGSASHPHAQAILAEVDRRRDIFNDVHASFFGVTNDPSDQSENRVANRPPGRRYFWDFDLKVARLYGAAPVEDNNVLNCMWVVIDPTMRIAAVIPFRPDRSDIKQTLDFVAALPPAGRIGGMEVQAPVVVMDKVFDRSFCDRLIELYESNGGQQSGFMRDVEGKTTLLHDASHKRRRDHILVDEQAKKQALLLIHRSVVPEIAKVHQFMATRMERYLVACYSADDGAHFQPHRDNTTLGTAHRRFAVSVNLNDDFEGGEICFPEYGSRSYKPPPGAAVVFSCSLLHAVTKVTGGRRYAFLPFLYDEKAAKLREKNQPFLDKKTVS